MTLYYYEGSTQQNGVSHENRVVAIKVDPTAPDKIEILDTTTANPDGSFILVWEDWDGRVIVGAVDDDGVSSTKLKPVFRDFIVGQEYAGIEITQAPVYVVINEVETGVNVTQVPVYAVINNLDTGVHVTQAPIYVIQRVGFNLNSEPPQNPSFNLTQEV